MTDLAKLYRPYTFDDVIGQESAVATLKGKLHSPSATYLLHGPKGTGKTTLARIFARTINCRDPNTCTRQNPCDSCGATLDGERHPDIMEMNASESRGIDDIRRLIDISKCHPANSYRVFILDEIHQLTLPAQNAMLKPFEEPSKRTVFILCTTNPEKLLDTIVSRAVKAQLSLLTPESLTAVVTKIAQQEKLNLPPEILSAIVTSADGHARDAVKALESYASALSVGGVADVHKFAQKIQAASPLLIALSYIQGQVMKEPSRVFSSTQLAESKVRFLEDVIEIYRALIYKASGAADLFATHKYASRLSKVTLGLEALPTLSTQFNEHINALATLKTYSMPEQDVLDSVAAKCYAMPALVLR